MKIKFVMLSLFLFFIPKYSYCQYNGNIKRIQIGFDFGYAIQNLSGVNRFVDSWDDLYNTSMKPINGGLQYSFYTNYKFFDSPFFTVGAELTYSDNSTEDNSIESYFNQDIDITTKVQLQTVSTFLNIFYGYTLFERIDVSLKGGVGYYHSNFIRQLESRDIKSLNAKVNNTGNAFGFHIGINVSYKIIEILILNSDIIYNSAVINKIKDNDGSDLRLIDRKEGSRKLDVDLSGFQFQIGIGINI